jgi:hypothetical protein
MALHIFTSVLSLQNMDHRRQTRLAATKRTELLNVHLYGNRGMEICWRSIKVGVQH